MNLKKRDLIFFALGLMGGAAGMTAYLRHKFDEEMQLEVDETRAYYKEKFEKSQGGKKSENVVNPEEVILKNQAGDVISGDEEVPLNYEDTITFPKSKGGDTQDRVNYNKIVDYTTKEKVVFGQTDEGLKQREGETPPYVISDIEMYNDMLEYDKVTLSYYEGDDTLSDDDEFIIADVEAIIGVENLKSFGKNCEDPDMLHIRNERLGSDYEIIRTPSSYAEIVLNNFEEE